MTRRYFYLVAAILTLISISAIAFIGCSMAHQRADRGYASSDAGMRLANPTSVTRDPTGRGVIDGQASEELWIIGRNRDAQAGGDEQFPGSGVLATQVENKFVPIPLKHTDVKASIAGYIA